MNFEAMIGTTGIASDGDKLYIANNAVITIIDKFNKKTDIPHSYDRLEDIAVSGGFLAGIYVKDKEYGIFLLNLTTFVYTSKSSLFYEPYRISIETSPSDNIPSVTATDNKFKRYTYDNYLVEKSTISGIDTAYNEVDIVKGAGTEYFMSTTEIKSNLNGNRLPIELAGDLLTLHYYIDNLFIVYLSHYNMYSVVQYNIPDKKIVKEVEGGYFSTRIYICIHRQSVYISSTLNKVIALNRFSLDLQQLKDDTAFPLFEMNSIIPDLMEDRLDIDITKLKERKQSFAVDTGTAESSHFKYYIWSILAFIFLVLIVVSVMFPATRTINNIILVILLVVAVFILRSYI